MIPLSLVTQISDALTSENAKRLLEKSLSDDALAANMSMLREVAAALPLDEWMYVPSEPVLAKRSS